MSEPKLLQECPIPNTSLTAQWWELRDGEVELLVQRPPSGEKRDRPFRWLLSESEIDTLYRKLQGDAAADAEAERLMKDLLDCLMVAIWIMRENAMPKEETP